MRDVYSCINDENDIDDTYPEACQVCVRDERRQGEEEESPQEEESWAEEEVRWSPGARRTSS